MQAHLGDRTLLTKTFVIIIRKESYKNHRYVSKSALKIIIVV